MLNIVVNLRTLLQGIVWLITLNKAKEKHFDLSLNVLFGLRACVSLYVCMCVCACMCVSFPAACVTKATEAACERKWKAQTINKQTSCKNVTHSSCVGNAKRLGKWKLGAGTGPEALRASPPSPPSRQSTLWLGIIRDSCLARTLD